MDKYRVPVRQNRTMSSFIEEEIADGINGSRNRENAFDLIDSAQKSISAHSRRVSLFNYLILIVLFVSIYESELVLRISGVQITNIRSFYEVLLFVSSCLSLINAPLQLKSEYLRGAIRWYFAKHVAGKEKATYLAFADQWQSFSFVVMKAMDKIGIRAVLLVTLTLVLSFFVPLFVLFGVILFVHFSAIVHVLQYSDWPAMYVYLLVGWVIWIDLLSVLVAIVTNVKLPFRDREKLSRLVRAYRRSETEWRFEFDRILKEQREERKRRLFDDV